MLEICFGTYLVLGLPIVLLLWMTLAVSKTHRENDQQRYYQIVLAVSKFKNAPGEYNLLEEPVSP